MHQSKLLQLLNTLNREEFRQLGQFLRSPYFNTNQKLVDFYDYLSKYYPGLFSPKLEKEIVFKKLYESGAYDDVRMRQLMFKLTKLVEQFMVAQEIVPATESFEHLLLQALAKRDLYPHFKRKAESLIRQLEAVEHKDLSVLYRLFFYNNQYFFHPDTHKFKAGIQSIEDCIKYLDQFFRQAKMRYGSELMIRTIALKETHQVWLLDEILEDMEAQEFHKENTLTSLFYQLLHLYKQQKNDTLFQNLKKEFIAVVEDIPSTERIELYQQLSNFAVSKINTGNRDFRNDFFELAKIALQYNMLLDKNRITDATFTNLVAIASTLKEFDWIANFIDHYKSLLEPKVRDSAIGLAWAYWNYQQGRYSEVLECLQSVDFLPSYGFRAKSLRLRTYFELFQKDSTYLNVLLADVHSFELYVRRHTKMNDHRKKTYLNFILYTKKLINLKTNPNTSTDEKNYLINKIKNKEPIVVKHWLLEKLKDL